MTDQQIQDLFYLVHDKSHIMQPGTVSPVIDALVKSFRTPQSVTLYRGLCKEDVAFLDDMISKGTMFSTWSGCLSFSETKGVARRFARAYKTNSIMRVVCHRVKQPPEGLDVHGSLSRFVNREDESEMDMLALTQQEKEWIFTRPRVIPITRKVEKDGLVVYSVSLVTL